ncbi:MAG: hypothetical protein PHV78_01540 [Patescibacteria group bacterium]|nr:hypothetical protein [Patescibacteria group bacterium]MDD5121163.1 hypothetical protein [Patescibacteria group bacterium]MDD5221678.1 hypothetical protein [Patescibacteria group bacterium]MDD5395918.1 hypothetical protein [Patescibacteria group bacterium]
MPEVLNAAENITDKIEALHTRLRQLEDERLKLEEAMRASNDDSFVGELKERTSEVIKEAEGVRLELKKLNDPVYSG